MCNTTPYIRHVWYNSIQSQQWWGISWTTQPPSCRLWTTLLNGFNQESTYVLWISCSSNFPYNSHITIHPYYTITEEVQQKKYTDMTTGETTTINSLQVSHTVCHCRVTAMMKYLRPTRLKEWWDLEHSCIKYISQTTDSWGSWTTLQRFKHSVI